MTRLPIPGSDIDEWGSILNDFLGVEHNSDGTLKKSSIIAGAEQTSNKGVPSGYAALDGSGKVPSSQLPAAGMTPDATASNKGIIQLAGDLGGSASVPTVPALSGKADDSAVLHKSGTETITGTKDFTGGITANSINVVVTNDTRLSDQRIPTDGSVSTVKLDGTVQAKLATIDTIQLEAATTQSGTTYTLALADASTAVEFTAASALTVTVPPNSSVAFPVGTIIELLQYGAGLLAVAAGSGVTIRSANNLLSARTQYSTLSLRKRATDEWVLAGDLA